MCGRCLKFVSHIIAILLQLPGQFSPSASTYCKETFRAPQAVTSKFKGGSSVRLLFGLIVRVVTRVELRGYPAPDVPVTSSWVSS